MLSFAQAGALPLAGLTALQALNPQQVRAQGGHVRGKLVLSV